MQEKGEYKCLRCGARQRSGLLIVNSSYVMCGPCGFLHYHPEKVRDDGLHGSASKTSGIKVILVSYPHQNKLNVIKYIRELTGLGFSEAKYAAEHLPYLLKDGVSQDEFLDAKKKFFQINAEISDTYIDSKKLRCTKCNNLLILGKEVYCPECGWCPNG